MNKISIFIFLVFVTTHIKAQQTDYQQNLKLATELYIAKSELADSILIKLVPENYEEFELLYATTYTDNKMLNTEFFYKVTQQIFDKVIIEKNEKFYLPSLQLASFADGEFGESFIENLEAIIHIDKNKFCKSIKGKKYVENNPIKYYSKQNNCE